MNNDPKTNRTTLRAPVREADVREEPAREEEVRPAKKVRARKNSGTDQLHIPQHLIPPGMDYQWVTDTVAGQPAPQVRMSYEANAWEPVPATRHPGMFMPKGYEGEINVGGLVLMERPMELTMEAREEEYVAARGARAAEERRLRGGDLPGVTLDTNHPSVRANTRLNKEIVPGNMPIPE